MAVAVRFVHLVARTYRLPISLTDDDVAMWLWRRLRRAFPFAFAVVLMPDHLHVVTPAKDTNAARRKLAVLLGSLARSGGKRAQIRFEPVPAVQLQHDVSKLLRQMRYVALNPVRAGLVKDPLSWTWSTHRDVLGAVELPWVTAKRLAIALGRSPHDFARWWHQYVTRDDSVGRDAATFPSPAPISEFAAAPLQGVARAVASATRSRVSDIRRRGPARALFLSVAPLVGWTQASLLGAFCDVSPRSVQRAGKRRPGSLEAVLLCLGDARLQEGFPTRTSPDATLTAR